MRLIDGDLYTFRMRVEYFPNQRLDHRLYRHRAGPAPVDYNNDDLILGGESGWVYLFRR